MEPQFRRRADGSIILNDSHDATRWKKENKDRQWSRPLPPDDVLAAARKAASSMGIDPKDRMPVLGLHQLQFGFFRGKTFRWVVENALGYGGYLVASMIQESGEVKDCMSNRANKEAFREYMEMFPEGREAISFKLQRSQASSSSSQSTSSTTSAPASATRVPPSATRVPPSTTTSALASATRTQPSPNMPVSSLRSLLVGKTMCQRTLDKSVKRLVSAPRFQPSVPAVQHVQEVQQVQEELQRRWERGEIERRWSK